MENSASAITSTQKTAATKSDNPNALQRNFNIFNGGKIRIDLTNTKYKVLRECAIDMKWKVITAKKKDSEPSGQVSNEKPKKESQLKA